MKKSELLIVFGALAFAFLFKLSLVFSDAFPFNSDEAVVALMARHILRGAKPIFFYGQAYMGSLDAWLTAAVFWLSGEQVITIRVIQSILYLIYMLTIWILARRLFSDPVISNFAIWVTAVPTVLVTTYTTATLGGYGEALILGNLILILGYEVTVGRLRASRISWFALGLVGGIAFWTLGIAGVYLLPVVLVGVWKYDIKNLPVYLIAAIGFFIGSLPWWYYNLTQSWSALAVLAGTSNLSLTSTSPFFRLSGLLVLGLPTLLGFRFPWSPEYAPLPVLFIFLLLYVGVLLFLLRGIRYKYLLIRRSTLILLGLFLLVFLIVFIGTHFGIDATGRYLLPLNLVLVLAISLLLSVTWRVKHIFGIGLLICFIVLNGFETVRAARSVDKITTQFDPISRFDNRSDQALIDFLLEHNEIRGYTNYWVSFRLAFLSDETIIFSPRLPYKEDLSYTPADNRYPFYDEIVADSSKIAFITTKHQQLDRKIRQGLILMGVTFSEIQIGEYHIFYNLSEAIRPEDIMLARTIPLSMQFIYDSRNF